VEGEDKEGGVIFKGEELESYRLSAYVEHAIWLLRAFMEILGLHEASTKGWMSFFFMKASTKGFLIIRRSAVTSLRICEVLWPATKSVVLGFSCVCGARLSIARLARAFLGFLKRALALLYSQQSNLAVYSHLSQHSCVVLLECEILAVDFFSMRLGWRRNKRPGQLI